MARRVRKSRAGQQRWEQMIAVLRLMNFAFNNIRLYPPAHTEVAGVLAKLQEGFKPLFEEIEDIGFGFMDELLYIEGTMSIEETANNQMLVDRFSKCRVKYLTVMKGVTTQDLLTFFQLMNAEAIKPSTEHPGELLSAKGVTTIHIVEAEVDDTASKSKLGRKKTLFDWYVKTLETVKTLHEQLRDGKPADLKGLYRLVDDMMATIRNKGFEPHLLLPFLGRGLDPHAAHAANVAIYCCALGELYGLNSGQIQTLCVAAFLHDLGRCIIPPEWAQDRSPLSVFDRAVVHQHPAWGFLLLARNEEIPLQIALLAAHHHEAGGSAPTGDAAADGKYRPDSLHKILNIADAYDLAAISDRFYFRPHRRDRFLRRILRLRGRAYQPTLAKLLANCVGAFPVGSLVRLADGRRGVVVRPNPAHVARPKLYMFEETPQAPPDNGAPAGSSGNGAAAAAPPGADGSAPAAPAAPTAAEEEPPPVILDLLEPAEGGFAFKHSIAAVLSPGDGLDAREILDKKKEYLLSYSV